MMGNTSSKKECENKKHQYIIVIVTAILSGVISTAGVYITAPFQTKQIIKQKDYDNRVKAYNSFLEKMNTSSSSTYFSLISINQLVVNVNTDLSMQKLERKFVELSEINENYELFFSLMSHLQILQLHGSEKVERYTNDLISVLLGNQDTVDWEKHTSTVRDIRNRFLDNDNPKIGWEPKVTDEERAKFIILSSQYVELIQQLKSELSPENT
ncbi:hypothetical protein [Vibrio harveyi]|uniref:hypothetical protein n=1 Tax=Vibrio harveyi TaxID=669 RepID=UPI0005EE998E|nr:hypothetical protein [Vibrio harveyi]EIK0772774.1 hypothetical protein [Vibrio alginolyticus]